MASTVQPPRQRTTRRLLAGSSFREKPASVGLVGVGLVGDIAPVAASLAPGGRLAALLSELDAGSPHVRIRAPFVVADELAGILDRLDCTVAPERTPGGLLLCGSGRVLMTCTAGTTLVVGEGWVVVAGTEGLELRRPGGGGRGCSSLPGRSAALGPVDSALPAPAELVLRWQLTRLMSALSAGASCLSWSEKPPLT